MLRELQEPNVARHNRTNGRTTANPPTAYQLSSSSPDLPRAF